VKTLFLSTIGDDFITFLETSRGFHIKKTCINTLIGQAKNSFPEPGVRTRFRSETEPDSALSPTRPSANPRKQRGVGLSLP
jgi:hypothetical protein